MKRLIPKIAIAPHCFNNITLETQKQILEKAEDEIFDINNLYKISGKEQALDGAWVYDEEHNIYAVEVYVSKNKNVLRAAIISHLIVNDETTNNVTVKFNTVSNLADAGRWLRGLKYINDKEVRFVPDQYTEFSEVEEYLQNL